jgi:hypothetical protein
MTQLKCISSGDALRSLLQEIHISRELALRQVPDFEQRCSAMYVSEDEKPSELRVVGRVHLPHDEHPSSL